jgi:hypothetical protein
MTDPPFPSTPDEPCPPDARGVLEHAVRTACAVLNEGRATLQTMNEARLAVLRCLDAPSGGWGPREAEMREWLEGVAEGLRTDGELTRTGVVTCIADAQAALKAALSRLSAEEGQTEEGSGSPDLDLPHDRAVSQPS